MTPHLDSGRLTHKKSRIEGTGTFSTKGHSTGERLGVGLIKLRNTGDTYKDFRQTKLGDYLNHSPKPNAGLRKHENQLHVYTTKNVSPGEEIVVNYREPLSPVKNEVTTEWDRKALRAMSKKASINFKKAILKDILRERLIEGGLG